MNHDLYALALGNRLKSFHTVLKFETVGDERLDINFSWRNHGQRCWIAEM